MALKKRQILQRVLDEIEPGKWNVAKPQDSEEPEIECIFQRKADQKEVRVPIDNSRFRSDNIDDVKKLVEAAINFPLYVGRVEGTATEKRIFPRTMYLRKFRLRRAKWQNRKMAQS